MVKVNFLGPIGLDSMEIDVKNFSELKEKLYEIKTLKDWLPLCAIALNDEIIQNTSNITFKDNDNISLLPPVCGG
ncbi:molybdopterin synthase sulfur carrier subunit [Helicobacter sp. 16-1353]|uniref:MoaD/ThiS family protein n=1 Tax=Helicobacter sp. 16-1353 TaxID=2004996 RepID=UPI000DCC9799|nr:MoaD/ThiS family protein [Helicobacter sp. 16-1353]RAX54740.1 molybdopterin synthase sulfur carrier subunit [Helicobacter sp. 16-1353]